MIKSEFYNNFKKIQISENLITESSEKYILNSCHTISSKIDNNITELIFNAFPFSNIYT